MVETLAEKAEFEPVIVAFCCNWCAYAGADLAGTSRFEYPTNVRIIRVMCSGRIDPTFILSAFRWGADGVLVAGCHPGDCHYVKGNYAMEKRFNFVKEVLNHLGIEPDRFVLEWVSAGEGAKFAALIRDVTRQIKDLGPSPLRKTTDAAIEAFKTQRLRWVMGISQVETKLKIKEEKYRAVVDNVMRDEIERQMIISAIKEKGPLTIKEISEATDIPPSRILRHIIALRKAGTISEVGEKEHGYLYAVV
jgi:coenzyme F420-reducing hydrogenase delta subunit